MELKEKKTRTGELLGGKALVEPVLGFSPAKQSIKLPERLLTVIQCPHCRRCCVVVFDFGPDAIILMWF